MPAIEEKYQHIRRQMVRNFIIWAVFMAISLAMIVSALWLQNSWHPDSYSPASLLSISFITLLLSHYIPLFFIENAPLNYHNDSGRMFAYRIKLGLTTLLLLFVHLINCYYLLIFGSDKWIGIFIFITIFRYYKLRPRANVWVDFRMRYRAGRTMPVRAR